MNSQPNQDPPHEPQLSRDMRLSHAAVFCFALGGYMAFIAAPLKALRLHASSVEMGLVSTTSLFLYALGCAALMSVSHRIPPKRSVLLGCGLNSLVLFAASSSETIPQLILAVGLMGATWSFFWPQVMAWMSRSVPQERLPRELGNFTQAWCLGDILGAALGGWLSQHFSSKTVFLMGASLSVAAFLLIVQRRGIQCEARHETETSKGSNPPPPTEDLARATGKNRFVYMAWVGLGGAFLAQGCFYGLFPLIARTRAGFPDATIGACFALMGLCQFVMFQVIKKWHGWHYRLQAAVLPNVCLILALLVLANTARGAVMVAAALIVPVGTSLSYMASMYYGATGNLHKMTVMSIHEGLLGCCLFAGGLLGGGLAKYYPMATPFYVVSGVLVLASFAQYRLGWFGQPALVPIAEVEPVDYPEFVEPIP